MLSFLGLVSGIGLLIFGGSMLVRGASEVAAKLGVSPLIVGLTVVGFGTSAPELFINVIGALRGETDLAFGNVVGSNISNLALVLGITALVSPLKLHGQIVRREVPLLLLATTFITVMVLDRPLENMPSMIERSESIVLLLLFCIFIYITVNDFLRARQGDQAHVDQLVVDLEIHQAAMLEHDGRYRWLLVVAGLLLLFVGGELTVRNGTTLATGLGVPTTIIGLFLVAVGTSMPELVTSIIAAVRGESDLALGNVVGSNIFNSLIVLPASGLIAQISLPEWGIGDLLVSWVLTALLIPVFIFGDGRLDRKLGAFLLLAYFGYAAVRVNGAM